MCIYYKNVEGLSYNGKEHVFPASLGGIAKLPKGMVSDKANNLFSGKMEDGLMKGSLLAIDRMFKGPGHRGSLSPDQGPQSWVCVGKQDDGKLVLTYLESGNPHLIPQFYIKEKEIVISFPGGKGDYNEQYLLLRDKLKAFSLNGRFVFLNSPQIPTGEMIVGWFDQRIYVANSGNRPTTEQMMKLIETFLNHIKLNNAIQEGEHRVEQTHRVEENAFTARAYAKIAMNTMAFLKGEEFVCNPNFDEFRKWIVTGESEINFDVLPTVKNKPDLGMMEIVPEDAHWCLIAESGAKILAGVCFYNRIQRVFAVGDVPEGEVFKADALICDWRNRKEYTLMELIHKFTRERHENLVDK